MENGNKGRGSPHVERGGNKRCNGGRENVNQGRGYVQLGGKVALVDNISQ